jgi:hypothetical protein
MLKKFNLVDTKAKIVMVGDVFGRLSVLAVGQVPGTYRYVSVCQCSCNSPPKVVRSDSLVMGKVESCGCLQKERTTTHGMTSSGHYGRWRHMMQRCYNQDDKSFKDYGGRGIKVCDRWHKVENFVSDMAPTYKQGMEIDRINNDGNYEPLNCRWVTSSGNANNRRSGHLITHEGVTQSMTDWSRQTGISVGTLSERINVLGWSHSRAVTEPANDIAENMRKAQKQRWAGHTRPPEKPKKRIKLYRYKDKEYTMSELSKISGLESKLLRKRINERMWDVERAIDTPLS